MNFENGKLLLINDVKAKGFYSPLEMDNLKIVSSENYKGISNLIDLIYSELKN